MSDFVLRARIAFERARERHGDAFVAWARPKTRRALPSSRWMRSAHAADQKTSALSSGAQPTGAEVFMGVQSAASDKFTFKQVGDLGPFYNVLAYGALGNNSNNDYTGAQAAITAAQGSAFLGGTIFFPPGIYLLSTAGLLVTGAAIQILGSNQYATVLQVPQNAAYPAIELRGNSGSRHAIRHQAVRGLTCCMGTFSQTSGTSGPASSGTTPGIKVTYSVFPTIDEVNVYGFQTAIYAYQTNNIRIWRAYMAPLGTTTISYGVFIDNAGNNVSTMNYSPKISYSSFDGTGASGTRIGFYAGNGGAFQDLVIAHCEADNATTGYLLDGTSASAADLGSDCHIDQCIADQCLTGIEVLNAGATIRTEVGIDGFYCSSSSSSAVSVAIVASSGVHIRGLKANGNSVGGDGVQFSSSSSFCTVTDGQFDAVVNGVTATSNCTKLGVHGNIFMSSVTTPIGAALIAETTNKGRGNISSGTLADFG